MLKIKDNSNLMYWFFGIEFISFGIVIMILSYYPEITTYMAENLTYDRLVYLVGILIFCFGIMYLSTPLSYIVARNKKFQEFYMWYIRRTRKNA